MKITKLTVWNVDYGLSFNLNQHPVIIRIDTDEGIYGAGEVGLAYGDGNVAAMHMLIQMAGRYLIGQDATNITGVWQRFLKGSFWGMSPGPVQFGALSAIDNALWDIKGKALGVPVYELLGGKAREELRTYANGWFSKMPKPEQVTDRLLKVREDGFDAAKFDPFEVTADGAFAWPDRHIPRDWAMQSVARVAHVRKVMGDDFDICLDIHGNLGVTDAVSYGRLLAEYRPFFYEEPVETTNPETLAKVSREVNMPIAGGERLYTRYQFRPFIENLSLDILQPDIGLCGGISEIMKIASMAEAYTLHVQPHNCGAPVATAAAVHACFAMNNFVILEMFPYWPDGRYEIVDAPYERKIRGGRLPAPTKPGLGIELNMDYLAGFDSLSTN